MSSVLENADTADDGNIKGLIADMLCVRGGSWDACVIISKACDLDCIIADALPSDQGLLKECACYMLGAEHPLVMRRLKLPHESCRCLSPLLLLLTWKHKPMLSSHQQL